VAARYTELGEALLPLINPAVRSKYGLEITSFIVENVSVPPEVEQAVDKRSSMAAIGNLNELREVPDGQGIRGGRRRCRRRRVPPRSSQFGFGWRNR
jgi:membrane protease subunit (stomatin/prohibitin family)